MIRTAISFLALFGSLLFVSKALTQTQPQQPRPATPRPQVTPVEGWRSRTLPAPAAPVTSLPRSATPSPATSHINASLTDASLEHSGFRSLLSAVARTAAGIEQSCRQPLVAQLKAWQHDVTDLTATVKNSRADAIDGGDRLTVTGNGGESSRRDPHAGPTNGTSPRYTVEDGFLLQEQNAPPATLADQSSERLEDGTTQADPTLPIELTEPSELQPETPATPTRELTPELIALRKKLRDVLAYHIERPESAEYRSPWGIMHALIAYGVDTEISAGGRRVNAIGWLCYNGPCRGQQLFYVDSGRLHARQGPGVQGHEGQFLAMLAQSKVKTDFPIRIDSQKFTVMDLIEYEKETCLPDTELTFKLIGLVHYLDTDASWKSRWGETWDLPRLIKEELAQPVVGAACGGTHRMMGFSYAVKKREKKGEPMDGQWLRAKKYVDAYHEYTLKLQNEDGSFSTNWFSGPGAWGTIDRRIETTGHILEWLVYSLPEDQLTDPRVVKAVTYLTNLMHENLQHDWSIGPKGHALHALATYDERVFQGNPGNRRTELAEHRKSTAAR